MSSDRSALPADVVIPVPTPDFPRIPTTLPLVDAPLGEALPPVAREIAVGRSVVGDGPPGGGEHTGRGVTHLLFTEAARAAIARARFAPAQVGGRPVRMLMELPFLFELRW